MSDAANACVFLGLWSLTPEAQAAWVQAIGSIGAICAAIYIGWRQNRNRDEHENRVTQRQGFAVALDIRRDLELWRATFDAGFVPLRDDMGNGYVMGNFADALIKNGAAKIPENIWANLYQIYTLGAAGSLLYQAVFDSRALEAMLLRVWELRQSPLDDSELKGASRELVHAVGTQHDLLAEILTDVVGRFDKPQRN